MNGFYTKVESKSIPSIVDRLKDCFWSDGKAASFHAKAVSKKQGRIKHLSFDCQMSPGKLSWNESRDSLYRLLNMELLSNDDFVERVNDAPIQTVDEIY